MWILFFVVLLFLTVLWFCITPLILCLTAFEVLFCGSWQAVELIRIKNGVMTMHLIDDQYLIEKQPFSDFRVKSRQATLSDCTCFLRPGIDVCILSASPLTGINEENPEPVSYAFFRQSTPGFIIWNLLPFGDLICYKVDLCSLHLYIAAFADFCHLELAFFLYFSYLAMLKWNNVWQWSKLISLHKLTIRMAHRGHKLNADILVVCGYLFMLIFKYLVK